MIQKLINQKLTENRKESKSKITSWRSSGLGSCLTSRFLERKGVKADSEFDERTLRVFSVGVMLEDWLVNLLTGQKGVEFKAQIPLDEPKWDFTGHLDLYMKKPQEIVYEFKSKHSGAFWYMDKKGEGANKQHKMQLWSYLWLTGVEKGMIVYISKDDLAILEYPIFKSDKKLEEAVMNELIVLNESWKQKLPPPPIRWDFEERKFVELTKKDWQYTYSRWNKQIFEQKKYLDLATIQLWSETGKGKKIKIKKK